MTLREDIQGELERETARGYSVERIRVTPAAIPGATVCLPIQSKRFELGVRPEKRRELLIHPTDWASLLEEMEGVTGWGKLDLMRAFGLPVANETPS